MSWGRSLAKPQTSIRIINLSELLEDTFPWFARETDVCSICGRLIYAHTDEDFTRCANITKEGEKFP